MNNYYYFASSLPLLSLDGKLPFSSIDFLADCQRLVSASDYVLIENLLSEGSAAIETSNQFYNQWKESVRKFRNELVFYRSVKMQKDPSAYVRGMRYSEPYFSEVIDQAAKSSNPMTAEKMMDFVQWQFLDEMCVCHYFDFEFIMCYGLKLKILERYNEFNSSKGKDFLEKLTEEIISKSREKIELVS